jgi:hypothetical protein
MNIHEEAGTTTTPEWNGSASDFARSNAIAEAYGNKVFHDDVEPYWSEDGTRLLYIRQAPNEEDTEIHVIDVRNGLRFLDNGRLKQALREAMMNRVDDDDDDAPADPIICCLKEANFVNDAPHLVRIRVHFRASTIGTCDRYT